jgi:hypothetical protein
MGSPHLVSTSELLLVLSALHIRFMHKVWIFFCAHDATCMVFCGMLCRADDVEPHKQLYLGTLLLLHAKIDQEARITSCCCSFDGRRCHFAAPHYVSI